MARNSLYPSNIWRRQVCWLCNAWTWTRSTLWTRLPPEDPIIERTRLVSHQQIVVTCACLTLTAYTLPALTSIYKGDISLSVNFFLSVYVSLSVHLIFFQSSSSRFWTNGVPETCTWRETDDQFLWYLDGAWIVRVIWRMNPTCVPTCKTLYKIGYGYLYVH